jgi:phosphosulfolactate synthase
MTDRQHAFPMIDTPADRTRAKPRARGLTMMVDWGLPLRRLGDLLEMSGGYIDLAKLAVGSVRVYEEHQLARKLALYREHGVRPFIGGGIGERLYALHGRAALEPLFKEARRLGFEVIEISDNYVTLDREERLQQTRLALDAGLSVLGEIGSKHGHSDIDFLVKQAHDCFDAGAEMVIVEGYELVENGKPNRPFIEALKARLDLSRALFELPGPWISGVNASEVQDLKKFLIAEFGADVSIGNVMPDDIFETEMARQGMSVVQPTTLEHPHA